MEMKEFHLPREAVTFDDINRFVLEKLKGRNTHLQTQSYVLKPNLTDIQNYNFSSKRITYPSEKRDYQLFLNGKGEAFFDFDSESLDGKVIVDFREIDLGIVRSSTNDLLCKTEFRNDSGEEYVRKGYGCALLYIPKSFESSGISTFDTKTYGDETYIREYTKGRIGIKLCNCYSTEDRINSKRFIKTKHEYDLMELEDRINLIFEVFGKLNNQS